MPSTFIQFLIVILTCIIGSRRGGLALGAMSGIGLALLILVFGLRPGSAPTDVLLIIIAAVTCSGFMQASGGTTWMIQKAERLIRRHPQAITFYAPICTFFLTVFCGTGHVIYAIMPIIADTALRQGIRPERPCAVASIASQAGIMCSPISAAAVSFVAISEANGFTISIPELLCTTLPAGICGIVAASFCSMHRGLDLDKDPRFRRRKANPELYSYMYDNVETTLDKKVPHEAKVSVGIFVAAILLIVLYATCSSLLPTYERESIIHGEITTIFEPLPMTTTIQTVLMAAAAMMVLFSKANPSKAVNGSVWQSGMVAAVAVYGISWMVNTFFMNHITAIEHLLGAGIAQHGWLIALAFIVTTMLNNSQAATIAIIVPLAYRLGIPAPYILGAIPCVYANFILPNYASDIATINFDRSGTTRIGKFYLNHSFLMPGFVYIGVATLVASIIAYNAY